MCLCCGIYSNSGEPRAAPTVPVLQVTQDVTQGDFVYDKVREIKIAKSSVPKRAIKPEQTFQGLSQGTDFRKETFFV